MYFKLLDAEQRRIYLDTCQIYQAFSETLRQSKNQQGGMRWKKTGDKEYLFKTRDNRGNGKSMGVRSPETEAILLPFISKNSKPKPAF